jgi:hypothetical protein
MNNYRPGAVIMSGSPAGGQDWTHPLATPLASNDLTICTATSCGTSLLRWLP